MTAQTQYRPEAEDLAAAEAAKHDPHRQEAAKAFHRFCFKLYPRLEGKIPPTLRHMPAGGAKKDNSHRKGFNEQCSDALAKLGLDEKVGPMKVKEERL